MTKAILQQCIVLDVVGDFENEECSVLGRPFGPHNKNGRFCIHLLVLLTYVFK